MICLVYGGDEGYLKVTRVFTLWRNLVGVLDRHKGLSAGVQSRLDPCP